MINENIAERLFCNLKNAEIKIEKPQYIIEGAKIGQFPNTRQLVIWCLKNKYGFNDGPGINYEDGNEKTFTEAYDDMFDIIKNMKHIKFYSLIIPKKAVIEARLLEFESVIGRYIEDYLPQIDEKVIRWDFMVQNLS